MSCIRNYFSNRIECLNHSIELSLAAISARTKEVSAVALEKMRPVTSLVAYQPTAENKDYLIGIYAPSEHKPSLITTAFYVAKASFLIKIAAVLSAIYAQINFMFHDETKASDETLLKGLFEKSKQSLDSARKHFPVSINMEKGQQLYNKAAKKAVDVAETHVIPRFNAVMAYVTDDTTTFPVKA